MNLTTFSNLGEWPSSRDALNCRVLIAIRSKTVKDFDMHLNSRNIVHELCANIEQKNTEVYGTYICLFLKLAFHFRSTFYQRHIFTLALFSQI